MKTFKFQSLPFFLLAMATLFVSCVPGGKGDRSLRGGSIGTAGVVGTLSGYSNQCPNGTSAIGRIYDGGQGDFTTQVAAYLSSFINPTDIGTIDGNPNSNATGVKLRGKLRFTAQGQLIRDQSGIEITVVDSFAAQGQDAIEPADYRQKGVNGIHDPGTRSFEVVFQDSQGQVALKGQYDDQFASGIVQFSNSRAVAGVSPQSGTLGAFKISKCGLFE